MLTWGVQLTSEAEVENDGRWIAEVLELSAETARVHAQRGRERLVVLMEQRHPDWKRGFAPGNGDIP